MHTIQTNDKQANKSRHSELPDDEEKKTFALQFLCVKTMMTLINFSFNLKRVFCSAFKQENSIEKDFEYMQICMYPYTDKVDLFRIIKNKSCFQICFI